MIRRDCRALWPSFEMEAPSACFRGDAEDMVGMKTLNKQVLSEMLQRDVLLSCPVSL